MTSNEQASGKPGSLRKKAAVAFVADEALVTPLQLPLQRSDDGRAIGGVLLHLVEVAADDVAPPGEREAS